MNGVISPKMFVVERGIVIIETAMMNVIQVMVSIVQRPMAFSQTPRTVSNIGNVTMTLLCHTLAIKKMVSNSYTVPRMYNVIGKTELNVGKGQFVMKMMKIVLINQSTPPNHHQFVKEFLVTMEMDFIQKAVVPNAFADVLEELIMKLVVPRGCFSIPLSNNAIGLVTSMDATKVGSL